MVRKILTIKVERVMLQFTGLLPGEHPNPNPDKPGKTNILSATLKYPTTGVPTVASTMQLNLIPGEEQTFDVSDFFASGLFKQDVIDGTILEITVIEQDTPGTFEKVLLQIFGAVFNTGLGIVTGGLSKILGAVINLGTGAVTDSLKAAGGVEKQVVGSSGKIVMNMADFTAEPLRQAIGLTVPEEISRNFFDNTGTEQTLTVAKDSNNGEIVIVVTAE